MVVFLVLFWLMDVGLTDWAIVRGLCRDAGEYFSMVSNAITDRIRIVEYATREQAQSAVSTLSNQNLMGRLVYVREVSLRWLLCTVTILVLVPWSVGGRMHQLQY